MFGKRKEKRREFSQKTKDTAPGFLANPFDLVEGLLGGIETHHKNPCFKGGSNSPRNAINVTNSTHKALHRNEDVWGLKVDVFGGDFEIKKLKGHKK